jgi:hypothetical protein
MIYYVINHPNILPKFGGGSSTGGSTSTRARKSGGGGGPSGLATGGLVSDLRNLTGPKPNGKLEKHGYASSGKTTQREEFGVPQVGANFAFDVRFKVAESTNDEYTIEFAGKPHSGSNDRSGYKLRMSEAGKGSYLQKQVGKSYGNPLAKSNISLIVGHEYAARTVKQNIMSGGKCVGVHLEGWLQDITAGGSLKKIVTYDDRSSPFCDIPGSRVGARQDGRKNPAVQFTSAYQQHQLSPIGA